MTVFLYRLAAAGFHMCRHPHFFRIYQIPMDGRLVESEGLSEIPGQFGGVSVIGVRIGGADGDVTISVSAAEIFVEKGIGHEGVNFRTSRSHTQNSPGGQLF